MSKRLGVNLFRFCAFHREIDPPVNPGRLHGGNKTTGAGVAGDGNVEFLKNN